MIADQLTIAGIDIGSTTSHCILVKATVGKDSVVRSRNRITDSTILYQSHISFTPFHDETLDEAAFILLVDNWISEIKKHSASAFSTGAIMTGLAAASNNRNAILKILEQKFPQAMVISAEDPRLESWVAWHGSCGALSIAHPNLPILNLDIGGGTTNIALGINGRVLGTGSYFIGARHFIASAEKLIPRSDYAQMVLLTLPTSFSTDAPERASSTLASLYCSLLEKLVDGHPDSLLSALEQSAYRSPALSPLNELTEYAITFSGGVGEFIYDHSDPVLMFPYGDLGHAMATAIRKSPLLSKDLANLQPHFKTRATAIGLGLHNTWISGSSVHLIDRSVLPLTQIPILARLNFSDSRESLAAVLNGIVSSPSIAFQILGKPTGGRQLKSFTDNLTQALKDRREDAPLILLVETNVGKVLGAYLTEWGNRRSAIIVLDEIEALEAHFVSIGSALKSSVPVSFFGLY